MLDREMYTEARAAKLLGVAQSTLHYWLEGGERRGRQYQPVLRVTARGTRAVTWAEFVEAGLLREYRRTHQVPMAELRTFIDLLRDRFDVPHPLADRRPYVSGKQLVHDAQTAAELDAEFCLVAVVNDQLLLTPPAQTFTERVQWEGDQAAGWRPDPNPKSPVRVSPTIRFGKPAIKGVSTAVVWEHKLGPPTGGQPREREILSYIVAGRTYGEIARDLVLSEKTVSVHVSHLHKTGTTNRIELAQLARRVASSAAG